MMTGLQRDVERRAARPLTRRRQSADLGVRASKLGVMSLAHHLTVAHDHRSNQRVRLHATPALLGQGQGPAQVPDISTPCHSESFTPMEPKKLPA